MAEYNNFQHTDKELSENEQNRLAKLYPFWFDSIPDQIPFHVQRGFPGDYDILSQVELEDLLRLKGQTPLFSTGKGTTFDRQTVLSSNYVQSRYKKMRAEANFAERKARGAVREGTLGIVGNNLDRCNTSNAKKHRAGLFRAQNMIQKIRIDGKPIVSDTVCSCGKPLGEVVELQNNKEHNSSSINGIQTCGSVWACPVCRSRIVSRRAEEVAEIYRRWKAKGGKVYMLTLTVPHDKGDNLAELYGSNHNSSGLSGALGKFRASRQFSKDFKAQSGYYGDIRGIEVTWGWHNGFHPHIHMLILTEHSFCMREWKMRFYEAWRRACLSAGLQEPSFERGVDIAWVQDEQMAQYPVKWCAATELTSESMKQAKAGNFSIAELERCLYDKSYRKSRRIRLARAASVLRAYYGAMKGQRMLQTGGIGPDGSWKKELLEIPDEEAAEPEIHSHVCYLEYRTYIKIKRSGQLPDLLEASERGQTTADRKKYIAGWLKSKGYPPSAIENPYPPDPTPLCFSYQTGFDEIHFEFQKMMKSQKVGKFQPG